MKRLPFILGEVRVGRCKDGAILFEGDDLNEALGQAVLDNLSTQIEVTIGDVTMHLAAWMDPTHWDDDWRERGLSDEEAHELLERAVEDGD